jgi:hypothetical protein
MPRILEIGVFNTTTTAVCVAVGRATTNTTPGTALTEVGETDTAQTPAATAFDTHGADQTAFGSVVRRATLGAAAGAGVIWTFSDQGMYIPASTTAGVVLFVPTGTGQVLDYYFVWRE